MSENLSGEQRTAIEAEIYAGRKIQAIKLHRAATGLDLKGAKDAVEAMEAALRASHPDRFNKISSRSGCLSALLVSVGLISAFLLL